MNFSFNWVTTGVFILQYNLRYLFAYFVVKYVKYITVFPRSSDPFHVVSFYVKWVPTSWAHSMSRRRIKSVCRPFNNTQ